MEFALAYCLTISRVWRLINAALSMSPLQSARMVKISTLIFALILLATSTRAEQKRPCKGNPGLVDACFSLRGRVFYANGAPSLPIWRVGTNRILGVLPAEDEIIPANLAKLLDQNNDVFGDLEVCPFTKERSGEMQMVCVESARHLVVKRNK